MRSTSISKLSLNASLAAATSLFFCALSGAAEAKVGAPLMVGAAKIDITPPEDQREPGSSVRDPLFARVLFIKSGKTCAIVAGVDKALLPTAVGDGARGRLKHCPRGNIMISATHTHSGGDLAKSGPGPAAAKLLEDAIVNAALEASKSLRPARMGFATTEVNLNVNRDAFDGVHWYQGVNRDGPSDKTMSVLYFVDDRDLPIGIVMNYGMHPIDYYLSGIISADFPGEASRYIERRFAGSIAIFTQGASGDQNPLLSRPLGRLMGPRLNAAQGDGVRAPSFWENAARANRENPGKRGGPAPAKSEWDDNQKAAVAQVDEIVTAMGAILGESAIQAMHDPASSLVEAPAIWSGSSPVTCPGRDRVTTASREGADPGYTDGAPVIVQVGLLRLGDVALFGVDSELYAEIVQHFKARSPYTRTAVIGLANGLANSGYIYSDNAAHHLTFQVVGSRLKPGCAEAKIIDAALDLAAKSANARP